jgi:hypothetical protein
MQPRFRALGAGALALAVVAEEALASSTEVEPSLALFQQLDARVELSEEQRYFFAAYFEAHASQLRDMRSRLNAGELSYAGALLEGRALLRELDAHAAARLDEVQLATLGEIRNALWGEFHALFFKDEHAWLLRLLGRTGGTTTSPAMGAAGGRKS